MPDCGDEEHNKKAWKEMFLEMFFTGFYILDIITDYAACIQYIFLCQYDYGS